MKNKKLCAGVLAASLMVSSMPFAPLTPPAQAASEAIGQGVYKDVKGHKHEALLQRWIQEGKVKGDDQGQVNPDQPITRAELAAFVNRVKGFTKTADISRFTDVQADDWYATEVARAIQAGYLVGMGPDTFGPNGQVTAEQAIAVALRLSPLPKQSTEKVQVPETLKVSPWARETVKQAIANGIFSQADLKENLNLSSKRADNILWLDRSLNKNPALSVPGTYSLGEVNNVDVQVPGVTLKNTTISGQLTVSAKAEKGNDTVTLDQVKLAKPVVAPKDIKVVQDGKTIATKAPDKKPDQSENKKTGTVTIGGSGHSGGSAKPARPSKPDKPAQPQKPESKPANPEERKGLTESLKTAKGVLDSKHVSQEVKTPLQTVYTAAKETADSQKADKAAVDAAKKKVDQALETARNIYKEKLIQLADQLDAIRPQIKPDSQSSEVSDLISEIGERSGQLRRYANTDRFDAAQLALGLSQGQTTYDRAQALLKKQAEEAPKPATKEERKGLNESLKKAKGVLDSKHVSQEVKTPLQTVYTAAKETADNQKADKAAVDAAKKKVDQALETARNIYKEKLIQLADQLDAIRPQIKPDSQSNEITDLISEVGERSEKLRKYANTAWFDAAQLAMGLAQGQTTYDKAQAMVKKQGETATPATKEERKGLTESLKKAKGILDSQQVSQEVKTPLQTVYTAAKETADNQKADKAAVDAAKEKVDQALETARESYKGKVLQLANDLDTIVSKITPDDQSNEVTDLISEINGRSALLRKLANNKNLDAAQLAMGLAQGQTTYKKAQAYVEKHAATPASPEERKGLTESLKKAKGILDSQQVSQEVKTPLQTVYTAAKETADNQKADKAAVDAAKEKIDQALETARESYKGKVLQLANDLDTIVSKITPDDQSNEVTDLISEINGRSALLRKLANNKNLDAAQLAMGLAQGQTTYKKAQAYVEKHAATPATKEERKGLKESLATAKEWIDSNKLSEDVVTPLKEAYTSAKGTADNLKADKVAVDTAKESLDQAMEAAKASYREKLKAYAGKMDALLAKIPNDPFNGEATAHREKVEGRRDLLLKYSKNKVMGAPSLATFLEQAKPIYEAAEAYVKSLAPQEKADKTALKASLTKAKKWLDAHNTTKGGVTIQYDEKALTPLQDAYITSQKVVDDEGANAASISRAKDQIDQAMVTFREYYQGKMRSLSVQLEDLAAKIPEENVSEAAESQRATLNSQKNIMHKMMKDPSAEGDDLALYLAQAQDAYKKGEAFVKSLAAPTKADRFKELPRALDWPLGKALTAQDIARCFDSLFDAEVIKPESYIFTEVGQQTISVTIRFSDNSEKEVDLLVDVKTQVDDFNDLRIKPIAEIKALDANQSYANGQWQGSAKGYQKMIDVTVTVADGKIKNVEKTIKGVQIDDGGEFEQKGFDGVISSIIANQDPQSVAAQLNMKLDLVQGVYNYAGKQQYTDEAYREAMNHFFDDPSIAPRGLSRVPGIITAYDAIGKAILPKLEAAHYDRVKLAGFDTTTSATWTARGTANAIVDALQKANGENDVRGIKVTGDRVVFNDKASKYIAGGYVQGDPFDFADYQVSVEKQDGGSEVIQGADFAANGIKVLRTDTNLPIKDGMPLTEANVGHDVMGGLEVTFLHEASGAKAYVKLNIARNEKLVLSSLDYRLQGEDDWKPLFRPTPDQTDNFRFTIPVPKADLDALVGKKIELRANYTDKKQKTYFIEATGDRAVTVPQERKDYAGQMNFSFRNLPFDKQGRYVNIPYPDYYLNFVEGEAQI